MTFYVIDTEDLTLSYSSEADQCESFGAYEAARARAIEMAKSEQGRRFEIVSTYASVKSPIGEPKVERAKV